MVRDLSGFTQVLEIEYDILWYSNHCDGESFTRFYKLILRLIILVVETYCILIFVTLST
jgi:hypothetical protein